MVMTAAARTLASVLLWLVLCSTCPIFFIGALAVWLVTVPFDHRLRILHLYSCAWASFYTYIFPFWRITIRGRGRIRNDRAYVLLSNHQSWLDILVLFQLYRHFKWVSKVTVFSAPFIGWNMRLNRYIAIRRGDADDARRMMTDCVATLASGSSILMFPEGTRSLDGQLRRFRHGAFTLAKEQAVPVLPIVLDGTLEALPKYGLILRSAPNIVVQVLEPIDPEAFPTVDALRDHTRAVMELTLHELQAEREGGGPPREAIAATA